MNPRTIGSGSIRNLRRKHQVAFEQSGVKLRLQHRCFQVTALRDKDTVSLEFVTSERIFTEVDLLGIRNRGLFHIRYMQLLMDNIRLQSTDANGRYWIARLKIDERNRAIQIRRVIWFQGEGSG